jgi:MoxR-like ATPase
VGYADIRDLAPDVLRHRIVLSYDALSDDVSVEDLLQSVLGAVLEPGAAVPPHRGSAVA